jgi:indolepyruvate ferredoxin oxidoreductase
MPLAKVGLNDKYDLAKHRIYVSGSQAILRLAMMQHARDKAAGLNTAGYITGYRGSPLGNLDLTLFRSKDLLQAHQLHFQPGLNEDLAATALWGAQQAELRGEGKYDGVFGIWYGKGPGVDRSGDVFRHANHAGTSKLGGVLALMGDDHTCESSTSAHQSEFAFVDAMMPILNPSNVQEILDYGLLGFALSRFAGAWVGLKCVKDNIEQTAVVDASPDRVTPIIPDFVMPEGGLNIRLGDTPLAKEARLHDYKRPAVVAFSKANKLDRIILSGGRNPRIGIITTGKSYQDVCEALDLLGIDEVRAADLGIRLYKVGMPYPLEPDGVMAFGDGLELVMVVEEKRALIEVQIKEYLYNAKVRPPIVGKHDEDGKWLFPAKGALEPVQIALALARRITQHTDAPDISAKIAELEAAERQAMKAQTLIERIPYFCAGCPHNSSTIVPEGSRAYAGIGCHFMAQWMDRSTEGFTQMGGEGANWIGEAPFSTRHHVFQNVGDGTFIHSGSLAIRAAVASDTNVTYKLLYNDAVAMTGGQPLDGHMTVQQMAHAVAAEGARRVAVVSDEPEKYGGTGGFPPGTTVSHRDDLDSVQKGFAETDGVTVLIYDQTCASEKRRRRKRGAFPDPDKRVIINELVCEGCGDCGVQSNCVAVEPVETEFGRKRAIDQDACNKDFSCLKGFCPSFVTVHGGQRKKPAAQAAPDEAIFADLPEPALPGIERPYSMVITGVGGTGVVTVGAILGMAAHLEGKGTGIIDMSGLAQKGGPVAVHVRVAERPEDISAIRASLAGTDLVIGGDLVVAGSSKVLGVIRAGRTAVVASPHETMTAAFTRAPDLSLPAAAIRRALEERAGANACSFVDAQHFASALTGDKTMANILLVGFASQKGLLPISPEAILEAIRLNGVAVAANQAAFRWGRLLAHDPARVEARVEAAATPIPAERISATLDEAIARRVAFLTDYQDTAYAERYRARVEAMRALERERMPGSEKLSWAVARNYFKLLAYKDEYEVARLYTDGSFQKQLARTFEGDYRLEFHLAPPLLAKPDPRTGRPRKMRFGPWMMSGFRLLAAMKGLRGTRFDIFGYNAERRTERRLISEYEAILETIARSLDQRTYETAVALAALPEQIRGYGPVKAASVTKAKSREKELLAALQSPAPQHAAAA